MDEDEIVSNDGSLEAAADAFGALMDREATTGKPNAREQQDEVGDDEDDALTGEDDDADTADDEGDESEEDETEGGEDDEDADAEDGDDDETPLDLDKTVTVKIDGKAVPVKLSEALAGYQRQADYTNKTTEIAQERAALTSEVEAVKTERAQYAQLLDALSAQVKAAQEAPIDWEALRLEDPVEYMLKRDEHRELQERQSAIQAEQARLESVAQADARKYFAETVKAEQARLVEAVPAWKDSKVWDRDRGLIREYGLKVGFSEADIDQATDSRAIVSLYKAMKYDRLMAKKAQGKPAIEKGPAPKPLKVGSSNKPPARVTEKTNAMKRLAQTGSIEDAAAAFRFL